MDEPLWTAITEAVVATLAADGATTAPTRTQLAEVRKLMAEPQMQAQLAKRLFGSDSDLVAVIAERTGTDRLRDLYPRLVATTIGAAWTAAADLYLQADPPVPMAPLLRQALTGIAAGLPDPSAAYGKPQRGGLFACQKTS